MGRYDLFAVDHYEFESLCDDLIGVKLDVDVKRGKPGPDGGRDGTFTFDGSKRGVVQAKHYAADGFDALLRELKEKELAKVERLHPDQYVLMTSCKLSFDNREEIVELFHGLLVDCDLYSGADICAELAKPEYAWVVRNHHNLWLKGVEQLEVFCGAGNRAKSLDILEEIKEKVVKAVQTESFDKAWRKLDSDNVIIITGQAGTGKTTLAKQLVADLVCNGDFCFVASDTDLTVFDCHLELYPDSKTLFYFDDFFGANTLNALRNNESSRVVQFIRRIRRSSLCKFIMTSRSYIVKDAQMRYEILDDARISEYEFELLDKDIGRVDRAQMLYAHLCQGDVSETYKCRVFENENYFKIIDHRNFNPRIVSYCFDANRVRLAKMDTASVMGYIFGLLDNPSQVWKECFRELNSIDVYLTCMVFLAKGRTEGQVREAVKELLSRPDFAVFRCKSFDEIIRGLCCSVLTQVLEREETKYELFNPSVGDYLMGAFLIDEGLLTDIVLLLEESEVVIQIGNNGSWLIKDKPDYAASCKKTFDNVVRLIEKDPIGFPVDFVLKVFNGSFEYMYSEGVKKRELATSIVASGILQDRSADGAEIVKCIEWMRLNSPDLLAQTKIDVAYLNRLAALQDNGNRLMELKAVYDELGFVVQADFMGRLKKHGSDLVDKIIADASFDAQDTEEDICMAVCDDLKEVLKNYGIEENVLSADECVDGYDFSPWAWKEGDGSSYEEYRTRCKLEKQEEDERIRGIFQYEGLNSRDWR